MYVNAKIGNESLVALVDTGASGFALISAYMCNHLTLGSQPVNPSIDILGFEGKITSKVSEIVNVMGTDRRGETSRYLCKRSSVVFEINEAIIE